MKITELRDTSTLSDEEIQIAWEEAYQRFETEEEEIQKFIKRLNDAGQQDWRKDEQIVELFCGRRNDIRALERLDFTNTKRKLITDGSMRQTRYFFCLIRHPIAFSNDSRISPAVRQRLSTSLAIAFSITAAIRKGISCILKFVIFLT